MRETTAETAARIEHMLREAGVPARGLRAAVAANGVPVEVPVHGHGVLRLDLRKGELAAFLDGELVMTALGPPRQSRQVRASHPTASFRWDIEFQRRIEEHARRAGKSKAAFVRQLVEEGMKALE